MDADRPRIALAVSAIGGIVTAIAVYQPFYGLGITPAGVSVAAQAVSSVPGLSEYGGRIASEAAPLAGRSLVGVTAHQALHNISVALLVIAAVAIVVSLVGLVEHASGAARRRRAVARRDRLRGGAPDRLPDGRPPGRGSRALHADAASRRLHGAHRVRGDRGRGAVAGACAHAC